MLYVSSENLTVVFGDDLNNWVDDTAGRLARMLSRAPEVGNNGVEARPCDRNLLGGPETERDHFLYSFLEEEFDKLENSSTNSTFRKPVWDDFIHQEP